MANDDDYTENGPTLNQSLDDGFAEEAIQRALSYGIPYSIYRDAFISADGDRSGEECSNILEALIRAAIWGAENPDWVIAIRGDERQRADAERAACDCEGCDCDDRGDEEVLH